MRRRRIITLKLNKVEAEAMLHTGTAGIADLIDAQDDESLALAEVIDAVMDKLGAAMMAAWPDDATAK